MGFTYAGGFRWLEGAPFPCWKCGAKDCRDEHHQQGCPKLKPLSQERLMELARSVENGWIAADRRRKRKTA